MLCPSLVNVQLRAAAALPAPVGDMPHPPNTASARRPVTKTGTLLCMRIPCVTLRIAHLLALRYVAARRSEPAHDGPLGARVRIADPSERRTRARHGNVILRLTTPRRPLGSWPLQWIEGGGGTPR